LFACKFFLQTENFILFFIFDHDPFQILLGCDLHFPPLLLFNPQVLFQEPVDRKKKEKTKRKNPEYGPTALRFILQRPNTFNLDSLGP